MNKVLTIVIAAYNVEDYLDDALRSCVIEDDRIRKLYEVIVVNDGSADHTGDIARRYVERYPETFRLIDKVNGGYGSVINEGVKAAEGRYFKLLDGDDWYDTQALEKMVQCLGTCDSDMVLTEYTLVHENSGRRNTACYAGIARNAQRPVSDLLRVEFPLAMHGLCYRTDVLRQVPVPVTEHCFYTDTEYVIYGLAYVKEMTYFPVNLYQYRIGVEGQSVSISGLRKHIGDLERVIADIDAFCERLQDSVNRELISYRIALAYREYITSLLLLSGSKEMRQKIRRFDEKVKRLQPKRYEWMENKKIRILRLTGYRACGLCRLYCKWEKIRDER